MNAAVQGLSHGDEHPTPQATCRVHAPAQRVGRHLSRAVPASPCPDPRPPEDPDRGGGVQQERPQPAHHPAAQGRVPRPRGAAGLPHCNREGVRASALPRVCASVLVCVHAHVRSCVPPCVCVRAGEGEGPSPVQRACLERQQRLLSQHLECVAARRAPCGVPVAVACVQVHTPGW